MHMPVYRKSLEQLFPLQLLFGFLCGSVNSASYKLGASYLLRGTCVPPLNKDHRQFSEELH